MNVGRWKVVSVVGLAATPPALGRTAASSGKAAKSSIPEFSGI